MVREWSRARPRLTAAVIAGMLTLITFPDVFFAGTSLRLTDQVWGYYKQLTLYRAHPPVAVPIIPYDVWMFPHTDIGGATGQSEPMMEFMRHCVWTLNSPYWNPYSSAGSLGPETLVDLKFSVLTLAYALAGGGTVVYNVLFLAAFWSATWFVILIVRERLHGSWLAAIAAGIFYLLNGFSSANVGSNVAQSYLFIPACLYASFAYIEKPSASRFGWLSLAFAALLSFTFLPTTIMAVVTILVCAAGWALCVHPGSGARSRPVFALLMHGFSLALAFALLAVIYLPFAESLTTTGISDTYAQRIFYPARWTGALALFTPSHFYRSYGPSDPARAAFTTNVIFHFGVLGWGLAACVWRPRGSRCWPLAATCGVIIAVTLGRIFGAPVFSQFFDLLPVLRNIGCQYLWVAVAIPLTLLIALGLDDLRAGTPSRLPVLIVCSVAVAAGIMVGASYGFQAGGTERALRILATLFLTVAFAGTVWLTRSGTLSHPSYMAAMVVAALFVELAGHASWLRFQRSDMFAQPTSEVGFLKTHAGFNRTMTFGDYATTMDRGSAFQLQEVTSLNMGTLPGYRKLFNQLTHALPRQYRWGDFVSLALHHDVPHLEYFDRRLIDLLGVRYIVMPNIAVQYAGALQQNGFPVVHRSEFVSVFENRGVLPRAFAIDVPAPAPGADVQLPPDLHGRVAPIEIAAYRNVFVQLKGTAQRAQLAVLTDNWHPGWTAVVNGVRTPIQRVEGTFRGIQVPAGEFTIELSYRPRSLTLAIIISALAAVTVSGLFVWSRPRILGQQA